MEYIKVEAIQKKLAETEAQKGLLYIRGSVGIGKTAAVADFFRGKQHRYLAGAMGYLPEFPDLKGLTQDTAIIFDDLSQIAHPESQAYIRETIEKNSRHIVLIGRGDIPPWLRETLATRKLSYADNEDLQLADESVRTLFIEKKNYHLSDEELAALKQLVHANTLFLINTLRHLPQGERISKHWIEGARTETFRYMDQAFFNMLDPEVQRTLLENCMYDVLNVEKIRITSANPHAAELLARMLDSGDFLQETVSGQYEFRPLYRDYMNWKQAQVFTPAQINEQIDRAAVYYELQGDVPAALNCFKTNGNTDRLAKLLIRSMDEGIAKEDFPAYLPYFALLPEEVTAAAPELMAGEILRLELAGDTAGAETWRGRLVEYANSKNERSAAYLDAMTHLKQTEK